MSWLHDLYLKKVFGVVYSRTEAQCADVFTKTFRQLPKWQQAVRLIGIGKPDAPPSVPPEPGPRPDTVEKKANGQSVASDEAAVANAHTVFAAPCALKSSTLLCAVFAEAANSSMSKWATFANAHDVLASVCA